MNRNVSSFFGDKDMELMIKAFAHYIHKITNKNKNTVMGTIRLLIRESEVKLKEAKHLDEDMRLELLENSIEEFIKKAEVSPAHRRKIRTVCFQVYERWLELKKQKENINVEIADLLNESSINLMGFDDQEVLLQAFAHYIEKVVGLNIDSIVRTIRTCMLEVTIGERVSFKETRFLNEHTRLELVEQGVDEFLKKIGANSETAKVIKSDCLKVYNRWKEVRRISPSKDEIKLYELVGST